MMPSLPFALIFILSWLDLSNGFPIPLLSSLFSSQSPFDEPPSSDSNFGRQSFWDDFYTPKEGNDVLTPNDGTKNDGDINSSSFSWYSNWEELKPFVEELVPSRESKILIPGVGNDRLLVDMMLDGYKNLVAFDYSPKGVDCAKRLLKKVKTKKIYDEEEKVKKAETEPSVIVADARNLHMFPNESYDVIIEKGTLDSIYLSGGKDKILAKKHLSMAVKEFARVTKPNGGIIISITAACVDAVQSSLYEHLSSNDNDSSCNSNGQSWAEIRDGSFYTTDEGYTSNNIDATFLAWKRN